MLGPGSRFLSVQPQGLAQSISYPAHYSKSLEERTLSLEIRDKKRRGGT